jgi:hypothetical protein
VREGGRSSCRRLAAGTGCSGVSSPASASESDWPDLSLLAGSCCPGADALLLEAELSIMGAGVVHSGEVGGLASAAKSNTAAGLEAAWEWLSN